MKSLWKLFLLLILVTACQPANTPGPLGQTPLTARPVREGSGVGLTIRWPKSDFKTQQIPTDTEQLQIEITEEGSFRNLYRASIKREEAQLTGIVSRQIRVDMQGAAERTVKLSVSARNALGAIIAKGEKVFTLKGGERSQLKIQILPTGSVVVIGGGGGGGGGGGTGGGPV
ncbi:MAG: hypothetical protein CVV27_13010, partial [Candidatus Melainabacteria bacterium HGW-Melainabacteria-1]